MDNRLFIGILTCKKYTDRVIKQREYLSKCPYNYRYFLGDTNIKEDTEDKSTNIVTLKIDDNYESLVLKVHRMIQWILNHYPNIRYILKTDDDIIFNFDEMKTIFNDIDKNKISYAGAVAPHQGTCQSSYHFGRCFDKQIDKTLVTMDNYKYCSGGGYFVDNNSSRILANNLHNNNCIYEDYSVGKTLALHGVLPHNIDVKKCCLWI